MLVFQCDYPSSTSLSASVCVFRSLVYLFIYLFIYLFFYGMSERFHCLHSKLHMLYFTHVRSPLKVTCEYEFLSLLVGNFQQC